MADCIYTINGKKFASVNEAMNYIAKNVEITTIENAIGIEELSKYGKGSPILHLSKDGSRQKLIDEILDKISNDIHREWEPILDKVYKNGSITADEKRFLISELNSARLEENKTSAYDRIQQMKEFQKARKLSRTAEMQVKNEILRELNAKASMSADLQKVLNKFSSASKSKHIATAMERGYGNPVILLNRLNEQNEERLGMSAPQLIGFLIAQDALSEQIDNLSAQALTDPATAELMTQMQELRYELNHAADLAGSYAGESLGARSVIQKIAGYNYESDLKFVQSYADKAVDEAKTDKEKIRILNLLEKAKRRIKNQGEEIRKLEETISEYNNDMANMSRQQQRVDGEALTQDKILETRKKVTGTGLNRSKNEILNSLRNRRSMNSSKVFDLDDADAISYYDDVLDLIDILIFENEQIKGFKDLVKAVQLEVSEISENDIYSALSLSSPRNRTRRIDEYRKRRAAVVKHVTDIRLLEDTINEAIESYIKNPDAEANLDALNTVGRLLTDMKKRINDVYDNTRGQINEESTIYEEWAKALVEIATNHEIAFMDGVDKSNPKEVIRVLNEILISVKRITDNNEVKSLNETIARYEKQIELIKDGRIGELIREDTPRSRSIPKELEIDVPVFDAEGNMIGTEKKRYNIGELKRIAIDKKKSIEREKRLFIYLNDSTSKKIAFWGLATANMFRNNLAMFDLSAIGIQGYSTLQMLFTDPKSFSDAINKSIKAGFNEFSENPHKAIEMHEGIIESNPYYHLFVTVGGKIYNPVEDLAFESLGGEDLLDIIDHGLSEKESLNILEKGGKSAIAARNKVKSASNAAFAMHVNLLSIKLFTDYIENHRKQFNGQMPSERELAAIARQVNNMTGRSGRWSSITSNEIARFGLWAPSLYISQVANLANIVRNPALLAYYAARGDSEMVRAYKWRAKKSMGFAMMTAGLYMIRAMIARWQCPKDFEIKDDSSRRNFLKIGCGRWTFDPTGGHRTWVQLGFALWNISKSLLGYNHNAPTNMYGEPEAPLPYIWGSFQYKVGPGITSFVQTVLASDFLGREYDPLDESFFKVRSRVQILGEHTFPIFVQDMYELATIDPEDRLRGQFLITPLESVVGFGWTYVPLSDQTIRKQVKKQREKDFSQKTIDEYNANHAYSFDFEGEFASPPDFSNTVPTNYKYNTGKGRNAMEYNVYYDTAKERFFVVKTHGPDAQKAGLKYLQKVESDNWIPPEYEDKNFIEKGLDWLY